MTTLISIVYILGYVIFFVGSLRSYMQYTIREYGKLDQVDLWLVGTMLVLVSSVWPILFSISAIAYTIRWTLR